MRFLGFTGAAALAAAVLLPGAPLGIGVPIVAALLAVAIGRRPWPLAFAVVPVLRDAGWVVAVDLAAAVVLTSAVLAGGESLGQLARGACAFLLRLPAVPKLVALPSGLRSLGPAAFGTALGGVLVVPFGVLFLSADGAFAQLLEDALPAPGLLPGRAVAFAAVAVAAAGFHAAARAGAPAPGPDPTLRLGRVETSIALGLLNALFALFVAVQLAVLFGGHDHVLQTAGLTYAEYARSGFWELLVVAALTLTVIAGARRWGRPHPLLLGLLAALCLVVVASSLRRMGVYEDVYGFTRLRISVQTIDVWLAGLLLLALAPARLAPRAALVWTGVVLAAFTLANPDRLIARHNVERFQASGRIDVGYLRTLSADARPELRQLPRASASKLSARHRVAALGARGASPALDTAERGSDNSALTRPESGLMFSRRWEEKPDAPSPFHEVGRRAERRCASRHDRRRHGGLAAVVEGAGRLVQRRHRLLAHRAARGLRRRVHRGPEARPEVRHQGHQQGQRKDDQPHARRRRHGSDQGRLGGEDLIGQGYKIIAGTVSSGVALQIAPLADQNHILYISGPAASDAITGLNKYTFRSGRQTIQDVLTADSFLTGANRKIVVFAQDSAFGQGNVAAVRAYLGGKGHSVSSVLVPLTATDFTPFAQQAKQAGADLLFVAWAGTTAGSMWKALDQQGVFSGTKVVTGLAEKATWSTFDPAAATKIQFLSHYVYTAPKNKVNDWLVKEMRKRSQAPDLFTPDGFVAAQMIVRALQKGDYDVDKMVSALEGWKFLAPKGFQAIRPQDHAMLQPMFQVQLVKSDKSRYGYTPKVLGTASSYKTSPPVSPFK